MRNICIFDIWYIEFHIRGKVFIRLDPTFIVRLLRDWLQTSPGAPSWSPASKSALRKFITALSSELWPKELKGLQSTFIDTLTKIVWKDRKWSLSTFCGFLKIIEKFQILFSKKTEWSVCTYWHQLDFTHFYSTEAYS